MGRNVDQSKVFSQGGEAYPKGGEMSKWIKSTYERRVVNRGRKKKGIIALGGGQTNIGWW